MLKTLLRSTGLATAVLILPFGATGPFTGAGAVGVSTAHAVDVDFKGGVFLGGDSDGPWLSIGDADDGYDDDDGYNEGYYDGLRDGEDWHDDWDD